MRHKQLVFLTTAAVLCVGLVTAALAGGRPMPPGSAGDNIALNKPYTMSPAPNYSYCTDAGDATQLTDGAYTSGWFWTQQSTVGWSNPPSAPTIIIDLGSIQPVKGVSYNTAGGVGGAYWPTAINLFVSNDGINYSSIGDLASISNSEHGNAPAYGTHAVHRYWTDQLATFGRYVKLEVIQQPFVFVDEIMIDRKSVV